MLFIKTLKLSQVADSYGMKISTDKTKVMAFQGLQPKRAKIVIYGKTIEQINEFQYLGYNLGYGKSNDVQLKLNRFRQFCGTIQRTLKHKVQQHTLLKFYKIIAVPLLLYGCENWTLTADQLRQIESSEMRFLRFVAGCTLLDHRRSEDIRRELNVKPITSVIEEYRVNWRDHVQRMPPTRVAKAVLNYNPTGKRNIGRPMKRWRDQFWDGTGQTA